MLGLALRHNTLHHLFALFLTLALATVCWCCWRRGRSYHNRQDILPRRAVGASSASSGLPSPSSPSSSAVAAAAAAAPAVTMRLDPRATALLPVRPYRGGGGGELSDNDDGGDDLLIKNSDCAICLSAFEAGTPLTVLPSCNHAYHPSCIYQWLQSHKDCPICRTEIALPTSPT